ncbi:predicted protein [Botrytis cinerea T4]|uniref:Uncharacterized protein n=1 Tax=Botryotinia fuckeliana (strain T4) TaxID=999810 RepID=G2YWR3_BOTF4|nr:predicted protein [Botrytis cinerea T4]
MTARRRMGAKKEEREKERTEGLKKMIRYAGTLKGMKGKPASKPNECWVLRFRPMGAIALLCPWSSRELSISGHTISRYR